MASKPTPHGDGPYRSAPPRNFEKPFPTWAKVLSVVAVVALGIWLFRGPGEGPGPATLASLPSALTTPLARFPGVEAELPVATPLEPLLAADEPERLAVTQPGYGAQRLNRHQPLLVRFNRPMVEGAAVGPEIAELPFRLAARGGGTIGGTARWTSRNALVFHADDSAWDRNREAALIFEPVQSLDGATLMDGEERIVVFDGTPHAISNSAHRVAAGEPLALHFDNPVQSGELRGEVMAYEIGGGARTLPFRLVARGREDDHFRVDLVPGRPLEAGMQIGVALAPRWWTWAGGSPGVMRFSVMPRPQIEGVGCPADPRQGGCQYSVAPGAVVDIGTELRILASEALDLEGVQVTVQPPLPERTLTLASPRVLELGGEFEPDQVYEVRFSGLRTELGESLRAMGPLAVRSRGHAPEVQGPTGRLAFEAGAEGWLRFRAVAAGKGVLIRREVPESDMLWAALDPAAYARGVDSTGHYVPMVDVVEGMRRNRFGRGSYRWRSGPDDAPMVVVAHRAGEGRPGALPTVFAQATDLAPTVRVLPTGVFVWVTHLSDATPVAGGSLRLQVPGQPERSATTDADGAAWFDVPELMQERFAVSVSSGGDRAVLVMEHGRATGPARLGLYADAQVPPDGAPIANVFTDRGAYRPGTVVRARATVRRIEGSDALSVVDEEVAIRLLSPAASVPVAEHRVRTTRFGTASAELALPLSTALGTYTVEVIRPATDERAEERIGQTTVRVAQFRQPSFRVDFEGAPDVLYSGDAATFDVSGDYLFGAPVAGADVRWSLLRGANVPPPARFNEYTFEPADAYAERGTLTSGATRLGEDGRVHVDAASSVEATQAQRFTFEVEITDRSGQSTAAHHDLVVHPASVLVGVKQGRSWVAAGSALQLDAVAVNAEGEPVGGQAITGRFLREGWHSWWEWSGGESAGGFQARREHQREEVHTCLFDSSEDPEADPTGCEWTPTRPGTYVLEVEAVDANNGRAVASRRLYVAGPDEAPDRDPPGAPIQVTPERTRYSVGEVAELAVESPWESAEILVTVENDGVLQHQRHRVPAGGHVLQIPVTAEMVPSAFVSVAMIRPRTGEPGDVADPGSPDLRFGIAELQVSPPNSQLEVSITAPQEMRPGQEVEVEVHVQGTRPAEVALWAVDEGLLRLTGYQLPNPTSGLYPRRPPVFSWDDLRTMLVSRIVPEEWRAGGDGGEVEGGRVLRPDEEFPEPVPLWRPQLETDADGVIRARFTLPDRATEYRIMAVAVGESMAWGTAQSTLAVKADVVLREALPRFATSGDTFEAVFFVHATGADLEAELVVQIGEETHRAPVRLAREQSARFAFPVIVPSASGLPVEASVGDVHVRKTIPIAPRARWRRAFGTGAVAGAAGSPTNPAVALRLPEMERGEVDVDVATHPFLGLAVVPVLIEESPFSGLEERASAVLAWSAQQALSDGLRGGDLSPEELRARGDRAVARLVELQTGEGSFGRWDSRGWSNVFESAVGAHALVAADEAGFDVPDAAKARALEWLRSSVENRSFSDSWDVRGDDALAYGIRVLAEAGSPVADAATQLYARRESLGIEGRAHLAFAMEGTERETLIAESLDFATTDHSEDEKAPIWLRTWERRGRALGPALEAASVSDSGHASAGPIAGALLDAMEVDYAFGWQTALDAAFAARGLAAYAQLFRETSDDLGAVTLDGQVLRSESARANAARFSLPLEQIGGTEARLQFTPDGAAPLFFSIDGEWTVPVGPSDEVARGRRVALHRRFETADGRQLESGESVALGAMLRVRLFVFTEEQNPPMVLVHDPMAGGFEAIENHFQTSADAALRAMLGVGPDDDAMDPRGYHAMRSQGAISFRALERNAALFGFDQLPTGLQEFTYVVRATTPGRFTFPPAQIESSHDPEFIGRSALFELIVEDTE